MKKKLYKYFVHYLAVDLEGNLKNCRCWVSTENNWFCAAKSNEFVEEAERDLKIKGRFEKCLIVNFIPLV